MGTKAYAPNDLEEGELETVAALCADAEVGEDEEAGVLAAVLCVLEVVEGGDDAASGAAGLAVLEEVELLVGVGGGEGGEHEIVGILEIGVGAIGGGGGGGRGGGWRGRDDAELDDRGRVDGTAVGWRQGVGGELKGRGGTRNGRTFAAYAAHAGLGDGEHSAGRVEKREGEGAGKGGGLACLGCWRTVSSYSLCADM